MSDTSQESLWLDARYIDDHILLTKTEAWTYVLLPGLPTNLPTPEHIQSMIVSSDTILSGLGRETELHYHLAYRDLDTAAWAAKLNASATRPTPAWENYLARMRGRLRSRAYQDRVLYMGVRLGSRTSLQKPSMRGATPGQQMIMWGKALLDVAAGPDPQPKAAEVARWREVAEKVHQTLGGSILQAVPAPADDVAWLIRHLQRIGMPEGARVAPGRPWGAGRVVGLAESVIDNDDPAQLTLKFTGRNANVANDLRAREALVETGAFDESQVPDVEASVESHVAILPISVLPEEIADPWLYHASLTEFPIEVSARVRILSPEQAEKDVAKAARLQTNAIKDAIDADVAIHGRDRRRAGGALSLQEELASGEGRRQIVATYRLVVSGPTREVCAARAEETIRHFRQTNNLKVVVEWPPGDQLALFKEMIPGQAARTRLYEQRQDLVTFAISLPFSVSRAGDGVGPYIGSIQTGNPSPVFYDMATAAKLGKAPTVALTGTLGGGKTFALLTLMDHFRLRGYPIIALDPKGDIKGHLLLKGRGDARFFDLSTDGKPGSLDPFTLVSAAVDPNDPDRCTPELADQRWREETRALVMDVITQLLADVRNERMNTVVDLAIDFEMSQPRPSMQHLMQVLSQGGVYPTNIGITEQTLSDYKMYAAGAYAALTNASKTQLGRLMFAPATDGASQLFQGNVPTTIVSLSGLDLPRDGRPPSNPIQRFSVALFSLIAHQARQMLQDLDYVGPRALLIDEAHQITSLPSGRALIVSNARMGRSRDIAMILATQSAADLKGTDLRTAISTVFAFRTNEREERCDIAELLGREPDDPAIHAMLPRDTDPNGTCLFLDLNKNVSLIRIDKWADEYDGAFDTNPDRENVSAAGTKINADQFGVVRDPWGPAATIPTIPDVLPTGANSAPAFPPAVDNPAGQYTATPSQHVPAAPAMPAQQPAFPSPVAAPVAGLWGSPLPSPVPTPGPADAPPMPYAPVAAPQPPVAQGTAVPAGSFAPNPATPEPAAPKNEGWWD